MFEVRSPRGFTNCGTVMELPLVLKRHYAQGSHTTDFRLPCWRFRYHTPLKKLVFSRRCFDLLLLRLLRRKNCSNLLHYREVRGAWLATPFCHGKFGADSSPDSDYKETGEVPHRQSWVQVYKLAFWVVQVVFTTASRRFVVTLSPLLHLLVAIFLHTYFVFLATLPS